MVEGRYEPVGVVEVAGSALEGYSVALNLNRRWHDGRLGFHDPATGEHIATFESEQLARSAAEAAHSAERETRAAAEARARELEAELRRVQGD